MSKATELAASQAGAAAPREVRVYERREITTHEHRAPTDESVKLLGEMEAAARERLLAVYSIGNSLVEEAVLTVWESRDFTGMEVGARFKVNGRMFYVDPYRTKVLVGARMDKLEIFREVEGKILEVLTQAIASEMLRTELIKAQGRWGQ